MRPNDLSISETGTLQSDAASCDSNDDTQSSIGISFDEAIIENIISQIPDTPTTRKSVTWSISEPVKNEKAATFHASNVLGPIYEPSVDGTFPGFDTKSLNELPPKPLRGRSSTSIGIDEGNNTDDFLIPGGRASITRRPSIIEDISHIRTNYMKWWLVALFCSISLFVGLLLLSPPSTSPPLFPLIDSSNHPIKLLDAPTLHVNRTNREMYITQHNAKEMFWSGRYSQSFEFLANSSFPMEFSQARKCNRVVDSAIVCCEILSIPVCYMRRPNGSSFHKTMNSTVLYAEVYRGNLNILMYIWATNEFLIDDGTSERRVTAQAGEDHDFKLAFLQNGTLFSYFEHKENCESQVLCMESECAEIRQPVCGVERIFPAIPANSMVLMHCNSGEDESGLFTHTSCTLSQILITSLATISRSAPFEHTRSRISDQMEDGFGDYTDSSVFHFNRLNQKLGSEWEVQISTYRLLSIL